MQFGIIPGVGLRIGRSASSPNLVHQSPPPSPRNLSPRGSNKAPSTRGSVSGTRPSSKAPSMRNAAEAAVTAAAVGAVKATVDHLEKGSVIDTVKSVASAVGDTIGGLLGRRDQKSGRDHAAEGLVPGLERTRDNVNGFAKLVAGIVGFFATNQVIGILAQPFKWIKLNLLFKKGGLVFGVLSSLNEYFTPQGQKIFSDVFKAQVLNGKFQLEMGQGLYIVLAACANLLVICFVAYNVYRLCGWVYEQWAHKDDFKKIEENKRILKSLLDKNNEKK
jgi:hypothetical protein